MNNSEKIYLGIIGILCYVLYFKANKKTTCPSCNCEPTRTVYLPTYISQPTVVKSEILEQALVYTGPLKFRFEDKQDSSSDNSWIYYVDNGKYFKYKDSLSIQDSIEITIKQMIDAWNLVK